MLGAAEKTLADIAAAREALGGDGLAQRLGQALRALERARERAHSPAPRPHAVDPAAEGRRRGGRPRPDRGHEALAAVDAAAEAFDFEPDRLDKAEERLFALRAMARKLGVAVEDLPAARVRFAEALRLVETPRTPWPPPARPSAEAERA